MLTRRTATVTSSEPEATRASFMRSQVAYLPVPTKSREPNVRPPTTRGRSSRAMSHSPFRLPTADEAHDVEVVPLVDRRRGEVRPGDHGAVLQDADRLVLNPEMVQKLADGGEMRHLPPLAVHHKRHRNVSLLSVSSVLGSVASVGFRRSAPRRRLVLVALRHRRSRPTPPEAPGRRPPDPRPRRGRPTPPRP